MMKWILRIAVTGLLVWLAWQGWQRLFVSDETRIKRLVSTMADAVEKNKPLVLGDCIVRDYSDNHGLDKSTLLAMVHATRSQFEAMFIYISDTVIKIEDDGKTGSATLVARILTKRTGGGETELNAERVRLFFRKTDDSWKMTRADTPELKFE